MKFKNHGPLGIVTVTRIGPIFEKRTFKTMNKI